MKTPITAAIVGLLALTACAQKAHPVELGLVSESHCQQVFASDSGAIKITHEACGQQPSWAFEAEQIQSQLPELDGNLLVFMVQEGCSNGNECNYKVTPSAQVGNGSLKADGAQGAAGAQREDGDQGFEIELTYRVNLTEGIVKIAVGPDGLAKVIEATSTDSPS